MSEQFSKRISTLGVLFIVNGILSFFSFNNYSPYSFFYYHKNIEFFQPKIIWFSLVIISNIIPIILSFRMKKLSKDTGDKDFSRFVLLFLISSLITILYILVVLAYSFFPAVYIEEPEIYIRYTAGVGIIYSVISIAAFLSYIVTWAKLYSYYKNTDNELTKLLKIQFGAIPFLLILGYVVAIISSGIGAAGAYFIVSDIMATLPVPFFATFNAPLLATITSLVWVGTTSLGFIVMGIRMRNKPLDESEQTFASQQKATKVARQSCPNCLHTIYEGQTTCSNCGYRI